LLTRTDYTQTDTTEYIIRWRLITAGMIIASTMAGTHTHMHARSSQFHAHFIHTYKWHNTAK